MKKLLKVFKRLEKTQKGIRKPWEDIPKGIMKFEDIQESYQEGIEVNEKYWKGIKNL